MRVLDLHTGWFRVASSGAEEQARGRFADSQFIYTMSVNVIANRNRYLKAITEGV